MVEQKALAYSQENKQSAFRHEFYEKATVGQIRDDVISYLAEYRFEVPDFEYKIGLIGGRLVDPNTKDLMVSKAQKAVDTRREFHLKTTREEAELEGLLSLEEQLRENPTGAVLWLSPPGLADDGYGKYGFAFLGERNGDELNMIAVRLEDPSIEDFNIISKTLWDAPLATPEEFLRNPKVLDIDSKKVKDFVIGTFEIKTEQNKITFAKALDKMEADGVIDTFVHVVKNGTVIQRQLAINAIENLAIELNDRYNLPIQDNVVFWSDIKAVNLYDAMQIKRYTVTPPSVAGSCGMSGKIESSNILGNLINSSSDSLYNKGNKEWFHCPKCSYKADGPVGNKCPGCGLTKEKYVKAGGKSCD